MRNKNVPGKARTKTNSNDAGTLPVLPNQPESGIRRLRMASAVAFVAAFLMLSLTIAYGLYEIRSAHANLERIMGLHDHKVRVITETQVASFRRADTVQMLLLETEPFAQDRVFMDYLRYGFEVGDGRNQIRTLLTSPEAQAILARQDAIIAIAVELHDRIADLSLSGQQEQARAIFVNEVAALHEEGHATFQALRDLQTQAARAAIDTANERYRQTLHGSIIAITASFVLSIGIGLLMHFAGDRILRRLQTNVGSLRYLAMYDSLTGLMNRSAITQLIASKLKKGQDFALLYMDLDGFKHANDQHGHQRGDRFLAMAAARIRARMRGIDVVARIGGDEFVALMENVQQVEECEHAAQHIIDAFASPFTHDHATARIGVSIGIAVAPGDGDSVDELLRAADAAMYLAKHQGGNRYRVAADDSAATVIDLGAR